MHSVRIGGIYTWMVGQRQSGESYYVVLPFPWERKLPAGPNINLSKPNYPRKVIKKMLDICYAAVFAQQPTSQPR
jgi:hypothetical protein